MQRDSGKNKGKVPLALAANNIKPLWSKQAVKHLIHGYRLGPRTDSRVFLYFVSQCFFKPDYFFMSQRVLLDLATALLKVDTITVTEENSIRYHSNVSGRPAVILKKTLQSYISTNAAGQQEAYHKATDIHQITGWEQTKFLELHVLFLIYQYVKGMGEDADQRDDILLDFMAQEIATTLNASIILNHCRTIDFSDKEKSEAQLRAMVENIYNYTHSNAMAPGQELIFPAGIDKAHAIYFALKKIDTKTYELRVDNAGAGSDAQEFSQEQTLLPRPQGHAQQTQARVGVPILWQCTFKDDEQFKQILQEHLAHIYTIYNKSLSLGQRADSGYVAQQIGSLQRPINLLRALRANPTVQQNKFSNDYPSYAKQAPHNCVSHGFFIGSQMRLLAANAGTMQRSNAKRYHSTLLDWELTFSNTRVNRKCIYLFIEPETVAYTNEKKQFSKLINMNTMRDDGKSADDIVEDDEVLSYSMKRTEHLTWMAIDDVGLIRIPIPPLLSVLETGQNVFTANGKRTLSGLLQLKDVIELQPVTLDAIRQKLNPLVKRLNQSMTATKEDIKRALKIRLQIRAFLKSNQCRPVDKIQLIYDFYNCLRLLLRYTAIENTHQKVLTYFELTRWTYMAVLAEVKHTTPGVLQHQPIIVETLSAAEGTLEPYTFATVLIALMLNDNKTFEDYGLTEAGIRAAKIKNFATYGYYLKSLMKHFLLTDSDTQRGLPVLTAHQSSTPGLCDIYNGVLYLTAQGLIPSKQWQRFYKKLHKLFVEHKLTWPNHLPATDALKFQQNILHRTPINIDFNKYKQDTQQIRPEEIKHLMMTHLERLKEHVQAINRGIEDQSTDLPKAIALIEGLIASLVTIKHEIAKIPGDQVSKHSSDSILTDISKVCRQTINNLLSTQLAPEIPKKQPTDYEPLIETPTPGNLMRLNTEKSSDNTQDINIQSREDTMQPDNSQTRPSHTSLVKTEARSLSESKTDTKELGETQITANFAAYHKTCQRIKHVPIQQLIAQHLVTFKESVQDINEDIMDETVDKPKVIETIHGLRATLANLMSEIEQKTGDQTSKRRASAIIEKIDEACKKAILELEPPLKESKKPNTYWKENRLRLEQTILDKNPNASKQLQITLEKIKHRVRHEGFGRSPNKVFMCYAWPDKKDERDHHLAWVQPFLIRLRQHLHIAGITSAMLDIKDNPHGGNIYQYMKNAETADFVLLIGTETLLRKHDKCTSAVCTELIKINRKREQDRKRGKYRVIGLLISGKYQQSFPAHYELYTTICDWRGTKSYVRHLQQLIATLYDTTTKDFADVWQSEFEKQIKPDEKILLDGLQKPTVLDMLEREQHAKNKQKQLALKHGSTLASRLFDTPESDEVTTISGSFLNDSGEGPSSPKL